MNHDNVAKDADAKCDNCDWQGRADCTNEISDVQERLDPGGEVPCGECPECGALAYLKAPEEWTNRFKLEKLRMKAKVMRDALGTAESFMTGFEGSETDGGFMNEADLIEVRAAIELHDMDAVIVPSDAPRFAVIVDGGLVTDVVSSDPRLIGVAYATIDYDTECLSSPDVVTFVPKPEGPQESFLRVHTVSAAVYDVGNIPNWETKTVAQIIEENDAAERAGKEGGAS
jgi:hypothetical protein